MTYLRTRFLRSLEEILAFARAQLSPPPSHDDALWQAANDGDLGKVRECLSAGQNADGHCGDILWVALQNRHIHIAEALLASGATIDFVLAEEVLCDYRRQRPGSGQALALLAGHERNGPEAVAWLRSKPETQETLRVRGARNPASAETTMSLAL